MSILERVDHPDALPPAWDALAEHYVQRRAFLRHAHTYNPCKQRYYLLSRGGHLVAGAVVYTLRLDLLTFLRMSSPLAMQVVGVPCSVSAGGVLGDPAILTALLTAERGLLIALNLDAVPTHQPFAQGQTLPTVVLDGPFASWDAYLHALRAPYRRRLRRLEATAAALAIHTGPCAAYTDAMHALYEQVYQQSRDKLEHLTADFFRHLPAEFTLTTFEQNDRLLGWTILLQDGDRWAFFLGGRDYAAPVPDLYFLMLRTLLQHAIDAGAREIDLGQTAEVPKLRLGGRLREKYMLGYHGNPLVRALLYGARGLLSYRRTVPPAHVFREAAP
jgi:hypothetical protein